MMMVSRGLRTVPKGWRDESPTFDEDMPDISELSKDKQEIVAYETVSEGTPISPNFPNTQQGKLDLVAWLAEHEPILGEPINGETWAGILFGKGGGAALMDIHTKRIEMSTPPPEEKLDD